MMIKQWQYKGAYCEISQGDYNENEFIGKLFFPERLQRAMHGEDHIIVDYNMRVIIKDGETVREAENRLETRLNKRIDILVKWNEEDDNG